MQHYFHSVIAIFLLYSSVLEAQTDISIRRKDFKTDKPGFEEAWKFVTDGDAFYLDRGVWYRSAYDEYLKAIIYNNSNAELNYKIGVSALFSDKKEEAAGFFLKALELNKDVTKDVLLLTGRALQYAGRFSEAIDKFNSYLNSEGKKSEADISLAKKCIEECKSGLIVTKDTLKIEIVNIGNNINSGADDYSELFSTDGKTMYFASRRELPRSSDYYPDSKFDENIFVSNQNNGSWELAASAGKNLTTKYCEAPLYLNSTNDMLYVYSGYANGGDIMVSENKKGQWRTPVQVPFGLNSEGSETSFTFSPSGNEIYYVTDKEKGNIGGKDIYFIKKINERKWSKPRNAGKVINTIYAEESVRFSKTGDTLWFSSKGHNTIGGFDIFFTVKNKAGEWDSVKNIGYPVNTPWDEIFYTPSPLGGSTFYFVSNRSGGFGGLDIYTGRRLSFEPEVIITPPVVAKSDTVTLSEASVVVKDIPPVIPEPVKVQINYVVGNVKDSQSGEPVMTKIDVIDISSSLVVATNTSSDIDGSYRVRFPEKKSYIVSFRAAGFLSEMKRINIRDVSSSGVYNLDIALTKIKVGNKVVLNDILFEIGESVITPGSSAELDQMADILKDNPKMKIEVSGHADNTGNEPGNLNLSKSRAKAVVMYLIKKGVSRSRMVYKRYGSAQPKSDNTTPQGRAKNRRVEFEILEF